MKAVQPTRQAYDPAICCSECGGREIRPPEDLTFSVGESATLLSKSCMEDTQRIKVQLPMPKSKKHPVNAPEAVHTKRLTDEIGLLKVAMFPGVIGIDVAKDIDRGIAPRWMQPVDCGLARQHGRRNRRTTAHELFDSGKTGSRLQPDAKTP